MESIIFGTEYYLDKILENAKKIKDENLKNIANKIEELAIISLLTMSEYSIDGDEITYQRKGKEYKLSLSEITSTYDYLSSNIVENGKVSIGTAQAAVNAKEEEMNKVNEELMQQSDKFKRESETDALTGLFNRRRFDLDCDNIVPRDSIVIMADVNFLKQTNDNHGHDKGDLLIKTIAYELQNAFPEHVYRTGGDEFYALIDKISEIDLKDKIEEIRDNLNNNDSIPKDSISFGYCIWSPENSTLKDMLSTAERRMYKEKTRIKESDRTLNNNNSNDSVVTAPTSNSLNTDMVYNIHAFNFMGRAYRCLVAPLYIDSDMLRPEIFCYIKNDLGTGGGFVSEKDSSIIKFNFNNECFLIQGRIIDGKFNSSLITSGDTLRAGFNIEGMQVLSESPESIFNTKGHVIAAKNGIIFHAIPLSSQNNENGICQSVICVEDGENRAVFVTNPNKETKYKDLTILANWNRNEFKMDII